MVPKIISSELKNLKKLLNTSFLLTVSKLVAGLALNKIVSIYLGISGIALLGQIQNFIQIISISSSGAINVGVTKYIAEYSIEKSETQKLINTSIKLSLLASVINTIILIFYSKQIASLVLNSEKSYYLIVFFAVCLPIITLQALILPIANGLKLIRLYIQLTIIQSISSIIITFVLILIFKSDGLFLSFILSPIFQAVITFFQAKNFGLISKTFFYEKINFSQTKKLLNFSLMLISSSISIAISSFYIRNFIKNNYSIIDAGYWQAMNYIASTYILPVTILIGIYYFPKLSQSENNTLKRTIFEGYKLYLPFTIILSVTIYFTRELIIQLAFNNEFLAISELFFWYMCGSIFKIATLLITYILIAKAKTKIYIINEITFNIFYIVVTIYLISYYNNIIGSAYAFAISYGINFIVLTLLLKRILYKIV